MANPKKTKETKNEIEKEKDPGYVLGFVEFIREQGVIGLAVGFILGGAISKVVSSMVSDIVNPLLGLVLGSTKGLENAYLPLFGARIMIGKFLATLIDFFVIASVVYFGVKVLRLEKLEKKGLPPPRLKL
jgi:large conductance mechanosensitive channel